MLVHINELAWGENPQAFTFGMVGKTSKACLADSGMFYNVGNMAI